jgi:hypothetical protein
LRLLREKWTGGHEPSSAGDDAPQDDERSCHTEDGRPEMELVEVVRLRIGDECQPCDEQKRERVEPDQEREGDCSPSASAAPWRETRWKEFRSR